MKRPRLLWAALLGGGMAAAPESAAAQAKVGAQADLFSSYVWRGVSLTNRPVAQPSAYLTFPAGKATVLLGGWGSIDVGRYDDSTDDISESGGVGAFNFAEFDPYGEVSFPLGKATVAGGFVGYIFPNDLGLTDDFNTLELYGKVGISVPLSPTVAVYYDVGKVNGAYIQGTVGHTLPLSDKLSLSLGGLVGFSAGQAVDDSGEDNANFFDDGLTHLDLSAGLPLTAGVLSITPTLHFQISGDDFARFTTPTDESDVKLWGGVSIGWSQVLGAATAAE